jgi:hypothetical protein
VSVSSLIHNLLGVVTVVGTVGSTVAVVGLGENEDVIATTEGVLEDRSGAEIDIRVMARSLVGGRTIEVPDPELTDVCDLFAHSL